MRNLVPFIADRLLQIPRETAAAEARRLLAASDTRDDFPTASPLPILTYDEWQARLRHEGAHGMGALDGLAPDIEIVMRPDGTGWCSYGAIADPLDAITTHLVGVPAEAKYRPSSINGYANGCYDFIAARLLIDKYNERGVWPPLTCEAAARRAVEFVDFRWKQISALALVLGSTGDLTDYEVRLFSGSAL